MKTLHPLSLASLALAGMLITGIVILLAKHITVPSDFYLALGSLLGIGGTSGTLLTIKNTTTTSVANPPNASTVSRQN